MRKLPEEVWEIAAALEKLKLTSLVLNPFQRNDSTIELLKRLGDSDSPLAIPCAARFLYSSNSKVRELALSVIGKLISHTQPYDLIDLSVQLSYLYGWASYDDWDRLRAEDVAKLAGDASGDGYSGVLGFLSFHRNGYVRHEALRLLSYINDGSELPLLIVRQNDWVESIAYDAQQAVSHRIKKDYIHHIAPCLRLLLHGELLRRYDHKDTLRRVFNLLCLPEYDGYLRSATFSPNRRLRHGIIRHIFEHQGEHQLRVIAFAIDSPDPKIRELCCRLLGNLGDNEFFFNIQTRLLGDHFMPVRREALEQKAKYQPEHAKQIWKAALCDASRSIRELARFMLKKFGIAEADTAKHYRDTLAAQPELFPALQGLSEVGETTDAEIFRKYLHHKWPTRRAAAINGLAHVLKDAALEELLPHLSETTPCVVRAVRKAIGTKACLVDANKLECVALQAPSFFSRKTAIDLIFSLGKWRSIPLLLSVAANQNPDTAKYAEQTILRWFQPPESVRVFIRASEQDKAKIKNQLLESGGWISENLLKLVQREVATF